MKRLRHPIRAIREPFGTAGLIVAMIALVAALGGTAFAAAKLNGTQKKEVEKIAKKYAGKPGANGSNGTNGANGAAGAKGDPGTNGTNGTPGTNGKSVAIGATAPGCGAPGGHTIEVAGESATKQNVCNGAEGSPWTELGVLPEGQAETGAWGFTTTANNSGFAGLAVPISFSIPLEAALPESAVHVVGSGQTGPEACEEGTVEAPAAAPGNLCVFILTGANTDHPSHELEPGDLFIQSPESGELGSGKTGAIVSSPGLPAGSNAKGVWIVRAPEAQ